MDFKIGDKASVITTGVFYCNIVTMGENTAEKDEKRKGVENRTKERIESHRCSYDKEKH